MAGDDADDAEEVATAEAEGADCEVVAWDRTTIDSAMIIWGDEVSFGVSSRSAVLDSCAVIASVVHFEVQSSAVEEERTEALKEGCAPVLLLMMQ